MSTECPVITQEMMERRVHLQNTRARVGLSDSQEGELDFIYREIKCADAWYANIGQISMARVLEKHERAIEQLGRIVECLNRIEVSKNVD